MLGCLFTLYHVPGIRGSQVQVFISSFSLPSLGDCFALDRLCPSFCIFSPALLNGSPSVKMKFCSMCLFLRSMPLTPHSLQRQTVTSPMISIMPYYVSILVYLHSPQPILCFSLCVCLLALSAMCSFFSSCTRSVSRVRVSIVRSSFVFPGLSVILILGSSEFVFVIFLLYLCFVYFQLLVSSHIKAHFQFTCMSVFRFSHSTSWNLTPCVWVIDIILKSLYREIFWSTQSCTMWIKSIWNSCFYALHIIWLTLTCLWVCILFNLKPSL